MNNMKRAIYILLSVMVIGTSSCKKFEQYPEERIFESEVFDPKDVNGVQSTAYLMAIYSLLPSGFNRVDGDFLDAATDDAVSSFYGSGITLFNNGQLTSQNSPENNWATSYTIIRKCNVFLQNIGVVPLVPEMMKRQVAEARFLRAFAYFELLKRYGGIPLIGEQVFGLEDNLDLPRNTYAECVDYIAAQCDLASADLPKGSTIAAGEFGRVPAEAAMALKCRLFVYAASPLFNGEGFESNPELKVLTGYTNADPARWDKAIAAAEALIAVGYYKLPAGTGSAAYAAVFTTKINTDIILSRQSGNSTSIETTNAPVGYVAPAASNGRTSPTQNFLNAFPNLDGTAYAGSSTNPAQYDNRDPRLRATIFYNGVLWLNRPIQTYEGGLDKPNLSLRVQTRTSYYLRKFMADFSTSTSYSNQSHNFPYFRYAEVLLNYAEALNERGRMEDAVKQIIPIRARAGITAGSNSRYGIRAGITQTELQTLIRNERRIELSFEEHRFWDLRRWKLGNTFLSGNLSGLQLNLNGSTIGFVSQDVATLTFREKYYHLPIPYAEIIKNRKLVQNEGYY